MQVKIPNFSLKYMLSSYKGQWGFFHCTW